MPTGYHVRLAHKFLAKISKVDGRGRRKGLALQFCSKDLGILQGAPLIRWAKEWWRTTDAGQKRGGTLGRICLMQSFATTRRRFATNIGKPWRSAVQGPVSAALWACTHVGWEMSSATTVVDENGSRGVAADYASCAA